MPPKFVRGVVVSGTGQASAHKVGAFPHFPGSLNVFVGRHERNRLLETATNRFKSLRSVDSYSKAKFFDEEIWMGFSRDKETVELFSERNLRATHGLKDGDRVKVYL
jgi:CTP-dependent riboflavin kinase